jgi:hypothetical protein
MSPGIIFTRQQALEARMSQVEKRAISLRETNPYINQAGFGSTTISSSQQRNQVMSLPRPCNVSSILLGETLSRRCYRRITKAKQRHFLCGKRG